MWFKVGLITLQQYPFKPVKPAALGYWLSKKNPQKNSPVVSCYPRREIEWVRCGVKIQGIAERHVLVSAVVFHLSIKAHSCEEPNH